MPTGYTSDILKGEGIDFRTFALRCARAMGATIMSRDEPLDAPLPEAYEPSTYYVEAEAKALAEYERLYPMGDEGLAEEGRRHIEEKATMLRKMVREAEDAAERLHAMRAEVERWEAPTPDHEGLRAFMLEQIDTTLRHDGSAEHWRKRLAEEEATDPLERGRSLREGAVSGLSYAVKAAGEERQRVAKRNQWIADLRASLAQAATSGVA